MGDNLPEVQGEGGLPTLSEAIANWLGFQLPSIPMPQTVKNLDKAVGQVLLAAGENAVARIKSNTGKQKAKGKIEIEGMYRTDEERRKLENRAASVKAAVEELNESPSQQDATSEIDDDWLNLYARLAEDKSSEELRSLFGKILAGEIRKPGTFSLRTMQFVSALSREEAHKISDFLAFAIMGIVPMVGDVNTETMPGFRLRQLMHELGIASTANTVGGLQYNIKIGARNRIGLSATDGIILINNLRDEDLPFSIECQALTAIGKELLAIASPPPTPFDFLKKVGRLVYQKVEDIGKGNDLVSGQITIHILGGENSHKVTAAD